jgi:glutathione S-transferase
MRNRLLQLWFISFVGSNSNVQAFSVQPTPTTMAPPKHTLYDVPVSNNGARCRLILYKKQIEDVAIVAPTELGGLKSNEYLKRNPQGKMPLLTCHESGLNVAESDTIARYLLSEYKSKGPSFEPDNPRSNLIARLHDFYLTTIQGCLYKPAPPFGTFGTRKDAIADVVKQLQIINDLVIDEGLYLCGEHVSLADATLFPTTVFAAHMLPKFGVEPALPAKLAKWYEQVAVQDADFTKVQQEIMSGLDAWEEGNRWDPLLGAGWRDTEPATLFDKILSGEIPAAIVDQPDDKVLAFKDINPAAPAHVLVIPKDRNGLTRIGKATAEHTEILGRLMVRYVQNDPATVALAYDTFWHSCLGVHVCFTRLRLRLSPETRRWDLATAHASL